APEAPAVAPLHLARRLGIGLALRLDAAEKAKAEPDRGDDQRQDPQLLQAEAEHGRRPSEPEAVPEEPLLDGGDAPDGPDPGVGHAIRRRDAEAAAQPAAARLDHLEPHLVAEAVARHRAQIAD